MKHILVTGANKGIGLAIVNAILGEEEESFVWLGSRDLPRGQAARAALVSEHPAWTPRLEVLPLDVADDDSVRRATDRVVKAADGPLYGIVNNAGVGRGPLRDVLEVNVHGVRRVTEAFLPFLDPAQGRIVNVTSASGPNFVSACDPAHRALLLGDTLAWPELAAFLEACIAGTHAIGEGDAYGLSKAAANAYTGILARRHPELAINACTPGFIETDMTRTYLESSGRSAEDLGMKPPSAGARAPMHLLFGTLEGNGWYYGSDAQRSPLDRYRSPGSPPYTG